jgi:hypothetical protein
MRGFQPKFTGVQQPEEAWPRQGLWMSYLNKQQTAEKLIENT